MKILIVDDTKLSRAMIIKRLPEAIRTSAEIFQGTNGREAVDLFAAHNPDIVFLDLTMPVMDGYEALERIKAHAPEAVVFVITADIQAKAKERVLASGASGIETKPIDGRRLSEIFASLGRE